MIAGVQTTRAEPTASALGELMRLGFANMPDYLDVADGKPRVDLSRVTSRWPAMDRRPSVRPPGAGRRRANMLRLTRRS
jgi:hypothetical protein